jgi:hypothetical protein
MTNVENEVFELLEKAGMNWSVNKEPLHLPDGTETRFFGVTRADNKAVFGTCTSQYEIFQNSEMAELAHRVSEATGHKIGKSKVYGAGERLSIDLQGGSEILEYKNVGDVIEKSIRITNSHDGSGSLRIALGSLVLSCTNGMTRWVQDRKASIRHTTNMKQLVDQALVSLEIVEQYEESFMQQVRKMLEVPVNENHIRKMIEVVADVDIKKVNKVNGAWESDDYSTRAMNIAQSVFDSIREEIDFKGATSWGLLNGITHYTTHKAGTDKNREKAKVFGSLMTKDKAAFEYAYSLVEN